MKIIKMFLIMVLVVTTIFGGLYYVSLHFTADQLPPQLSSLPNIAPQILSLVGQASQAAPAVEQAGNVLGVSSSIANTATGVLKNAPSKGDASGIQKTFEKARYMYCQQVIQDYDVRYGTASSSITAPAKTP